MVFKENWKSFVAGDDFSSSARFTLSDTSSKSEDRIDLLCNLSAGKKVIHFGCADHVPLIKDKVQGGRWLHQRLEESSKKIVGLDYNLEAIEYISTVLGRQDCLPFDLHRDDVPETLKSEIWDALIMGEILEHVDDPVDFLHRLSGKFQGMCRQIIISVPNCFSWENIGYSLRNKEFINTDHRYWFSPYTIAKVAHRAGIEVADIYMCGSTSGRSSLYRFMVNRTPMLRETLVATLDLPA